MIDNVIPYKIYLTEEEMPTSWMNLRAFMKNKPAPLLNPTTLEPMTLEEMSEVFCYELAKQELDDETKYKNGRSKLSFSRTDGGLLR